MGDDGATRRRRWARRPAAPPAEVPFEPQALTGLFAPPRWLRDLGRSAWLAVGVGLLLVGIVWLLSLTAVIVTPVIAAAVVAAVAAPVVTMLGQHGIGRGAAAGMLLVSVIVIGLVAIALIVAGVAGEASSIGDELTAAKDTVTGWLGDAGIDPGTAKQTGDDVQQALESAVPALLQGIGTSITALSSLVVFLSLTALSLFFLLKDGPLIRRWAESHMRVTAPVAHGMTERVLQSLRGYFLGVTFIAIFNTVVVLLGALVLGVPQLGAIAVVTFLGAYVPYLGAWAAGAFTVLVALGGAGTEAAIGMIVVQLLANGVLQQLVQPIAYGAALGIHPLAVLIVTMAGGALFGAVGLILAAPLTAAATRVAGDLARARGDEDATGPPGRPGAAGDLAPAPDTAPVP